MNIETKEKDNFKIRNCYDIWSFEDKVLIEIRENKKLTYKLFKLKESDLELLDEKTDSDRFYGYGNLGILSSADNKELFNFSSGKLVFSENKIERDEYFYNTLVGPTEYTKFAITKDYAKAPSRYYFYNSLVGPTKYPEFAEEICP